MLHEVKKRCRQAAVDLFRRPETEDRRGAQGGERQTQSRAEEGAPTQTGHGGQRGREGGE